MPTVRQKKIQEYIKKEVSVIIRDRVSDPRINGTMVSITEVKISPDLRRAVVYFSAICEEKKKNLILHGLRSSTKFIKRELAVAFRESRTRVLPDIEFELDSSIEKSLDMARLIESARSGDPDHIAGEVDEDADDDVDTDAGFDTADDIEED